MFALFFNIKEGDTVTRMLGGVIPQELVVTKVTDDRIVCGMWEFSRGNGHEIDEDIPVLVSYLKSPKPNSNV